MSKENTSLKEVMENKFLCNDSLPATAGKFLLAGLATAPLLLAGAILPGLFSMVKTIDKQNKFSKKQIRSAYYNLKNRKLIEIIQERDDCVRVKLTNKGKRRIKNFYFSNLQIEKPKKWDGKWRILIFDIPTKPKIFNQARNALRDKIKELGFCQMQKSVWAYPHECEDEILLISEIYNIQKFVEIITAEKILHENIIKHHFNLF